ncbi:GNAT family N-acetyltransferase [Lachnospiraceae bacterium 66-29]
MITIKKMEQKDTNEVFEMMRDFYDSPAILHDVSEEVLRRDIDACTSDNPYMEGLVFRAHGGIAGYAMLAKSFSTEFGGICIWIEDLYMKPEYRGGGIGTQFFGYLEKTYQGQAVLLKLEVERGNTWAIEVYKKCGYRELPYMEMIKELPRGL